MNATQIPYRELITDTLEQINSPDALKRIYMLANRLYRKERAEQTESKE